jgi:hypothetical protein
MAAQRVMPLPMYDIDSPPRPAWKAETTWWSHNKKKFQYKCPYLFNCLKDGYQNIKLEDINYTTKLLRVLNLIVCP